jgi:hypothetical protein
MGAPAAITTAVDAFTEDYVIRGRCPADDSQDARQAAEQTRKGAR